MSFTLEIGSLRESVILTLFFIGQVNAALAQTATEKIEVSGQRISGFDLDSGTRKIQSRELFKFGDVNLLDALKRLPGLIVIEKPGVDPEISLTSLSNGRSLIFIDGVQVSPKALQSLMADQIQRIDVQVTPSSENTSQASGGTINVILREKRAGTPDVLNAGVSLRSEYPSLRIGASGVRTFGDTEYYGSIQIKNDREPTNNITTFERVQPELISRTSDRNALAEATLLSSRGGVKLKLSNETKAEITFDSAHETLSWITRGATTEATSFGTPLITTENVSTKRNDWSGGAALTAQHNFDSGENVSIKCRIRADRRRTHSSTDVDGIDGFLRRVDSTLNDKVTDCRTDLDDGLDRNRLKLGIAMKYLSRGESRNQTEIDSQGFLESVQDSFAAKVFQPAVYFQKEFQSGKFSAIHLGLRVEMLRIQSMNQLGDSVRQSHSSTSPTIRATYKPWSDVSTSVGWARAYKAPSLRDLIPRPWMGINNSPTSPYFRGNPYLKPELTDTFEGQVQVRLPIKGTLDARIATRKLRNPLVDGVYQDAGIWYESPFNAERGRLSTIDIDIRQRLSDISPDLPQVSIMLSAVVGKSKVEYLEGGSSNLPEFSPKSAAISVDYQYSPNAIFGASYRYREGTRSAPSSAQLLDKSASQLVDFYFNYSLRKNIKLRASASCNVGGPSVVRNGYDSQTHREISIQSQYKPATISANVEVLF